MDSQKKLERQKAKKKVALYTPPAEDRDKLVVDKCAPEELDTGVIVEEGAVGVREDAEELGLLFAKPATGGPGNTY
jgi:hypothetical protein